MFQEEKIRSSTCSNASVCSTEATRMDVKMISSQPKRKLNSVSVETSVRNALKHICSRVVNLEGSPSRDIVKSFLIIFLARRSERELMFSKLEYGRFLESFCKTARNLLRHQSDDCREQGFAKYYLDKYMAQAIGDTEMYPTKPSWIASPLFCGWLRRAVVRAISKRDVAFVYSLQKGSKQMWPQLSVENVRASIRKSIDRLTVHRGIVGEEFSDVIQGIATEVFRDIKHSPTDCGTKFMPSQSACSQASRADGGCLSLFGTLGKPDRELVRTIGKLRALSLSIDQWRSDEFTHALDNVTTRLENPDNWSSVFDTNFVPIFEPGKIRNISTGDGFLATLLQPLQGEMLNAWKRDRMSTMLDDDLTASVRDMDNFVKEDYFISGDYEAATDLLYRDATVTALRGLPEHPLLNLAFMSLTVGSMEYPDPDAPGKLGLKKLKIPLAEGQLMGHTLSFPLLCVINKAVLRRSLDLWVSSSENLDIKIDRGRRAKLIFRYAKVNGDDILFKGPLELSLIFNSTSQLVGFKPSAGKNYRSRDCCLINSQLFLRRNGEMRRYGYLNLRLVNGMNIKERKAIGENPVSPTFIGRDLTKMVSLCSWSRSVIPMAMNRFMEKSKGFNWFTPNWYLPVHLGGYGVDIALAPDDFIITREQRLLAAMFINDPSLVLFRCSGISRAASLEMVAVLNPRIIRDAYVISSSEVDLSFDPTSRDPWLERICYANQARKMVQAVDPDLELFLIVNKIRRDRRLRPINLEKLAYYSHIRLIAYKMPDCPPLGNLKILIDPVLNTRSVNVKKRPVLLKNFGPSLFRSL